MKKVTQSYHQNVGHASIYAEDIGELYTILAESLPPLPNPPEPPPPLPAADPPRLGMRGSVPPAEQAARADRMALEQRHATAIREYERAKWTYDRLVNDRRIRIKLKGYELDRPEELAEIKEVADEEVTIRVDDPVIHITMKPGWILGGVTVWSMADSPLVRGIASTVRDYVEKHARPRGIIPWVLRSTFMRAAGTMIVMTMICGALLSVLVSLVAPKVGQYVGGLGWIFVLPFDFLPASTVSTSRRPTRTFWVRNRDKIVPPIIVGIVVGVVMLLIGIAIGRAK